MVVEIFFRMVLRVPRTWLSEAIYCCVSGVLAEVAPTPSGSILVTHSRTCR
jgi:hypothetical protein